MKDRFRTAMACAALVATTVASASAQTTFRETGSVTIGNNLVWVRGTNAGVVELFVGRGFRDAFARPHEIDATKVQHWIDSVRAVPPMPADDSSGGDSQLRGSMLSADVTIMRRVGGPLSGLRLLLSGEDPIQMAEPTARDFIAVLDSAAKVARELATPAPVTVAAAVATVTTAPTLQTVAPAPTPEPVPAPSPRPASVTPSPVTPATPPVPPSEPMGASTAQPAPELVLPAPAAPMLLLASRVEIMPLPLPPVVAPAPAAVAPAPAAIESPPIAATAPIAVTTPPVIAPTPPVVAPAADSLVAPHADVPADKLIHTPLGPFTVPGALLSDRDKEAQYCYTQLGLKYNPDLKGEITIRVSLSGDGMVQDAVVTKRSWQGISAGEVESCVRALAHDWSFPSTDPTIADGSKLLTFSFAP